MTTLKDVCKAPNEIFPFDHPVIEYPQWASTKFDGFRMLSLCGEQHVSPALKPIANRNILEHFATAFKFCKDARYVLDGELWSPELTFSQLSSIIRSHHKPIPPSVKYYVFDMMTEDEWESETEPHFIQRSINCSQILQCLPNIVPVVQRMVKNAQEAQECFDQHIANGQEGIIMRSGHARYKHGRFTDKQDGMWKFKEFITHDAKVVGFEQAEVMREGLERTTDAQGKLERTYKQEDYTPIDMVGAFWVEQDGLRFKVKPGKGHDNEWKRDVWFNRQEWLGKHIEYKFMPHGTKDKPRIGSLVRRRFDLD